MTTDIKQWAANRNTDLLIAAEIIDMANGDAVRAEVIWELRLADDVWSVFASLVHQRPDHDEYALQWGDKTLGELLDDLT